jgi:hypothetical protein
VEDEKVEDDDVEKAGGDDIEDDNVEEDDDHDDDDEKYDPQFVRPSVVENKNHLTPEFTGPQDRGNRFVRACAVEMHMNMTQELFYAKNSGKMLRHRR